MFAGTSNILKPEKPGRLQVPQRPHNGNGSLEYYLTPELEKEFRRLFPVTMNRKMMELFGISFSTLQRFKRALGLQKDDKVIRKKLAQQVKKICEANGYYASLRGRPLSQAAIEAAKKLRAEGFNPIAALKKKNPRKYKRYIEKKRQDRLALEEEIRRYTRWASTILPPLLTTDRRLSTHADSCSTATTPKNEDISLEISVKTVESVIIYITISIHQGRQSLSEISNLTTSVCCNYSKENDARKTKNSYRTRRKAACRDSHPDFWH